MIPKVQPAYALRKLLRQPGITAAIVAVLALGIGANLLMFLVYDHLVVRPLPYPDLDRLAVLWETNLDQGIQQGAVSIPNYLDWTERTTSFEGLAAVQRAPLSFSLQPGGEPEILSAARTTNDFFRVTQARLAFGEGFPQSGPGDSADLAVISFSLWKRSFGADESVLGRTFQVDGRPVTLTGVLREAEEFPRGVDLWVSTRWTSEPGQRGNRSLLVLGRLKSATALAQANDEMTSIMHRLSEEFPDVNARAGVRVDLLKTSLVAGLGPTAKLVFIAIGLSLLVVCVNVGNLVQVQTAARQKEFGLRMVLGAQFQDLCGQIALELLFLSLAGSLLALPIAFAGRQLLAASAIGPVLRADTLSFDYRIWLFGCGLCVAVAFCLAVAPALHLLGPRFKAVGVGGEHLDRGQENRSAVLLRFLTVVQIAISLPLIVGSILLADNLRQIDRVDLGFQKQQIETWKLAFPRSGANPVQRAQIVAEALERVRGVSGVVHCGLVSSLPFSGSRSAGNFLIVNRPPDPAGNETHSDFRVVAGEYFSALGIPLIEGRFFTDSDGPTAPGVAIVNAALATRYWPNESPVGRRIRVGTPEEKAIFGGSIEREIVGVVGNVLNEGTGSDRSPELYVPYGQNPTQVMTLAVHHLPADPSGVVAATPKAVLGGRTDLMVSGRQSMGELVSRSRGYPELQAGIVAVLGVISVFLIGLTIYAVISYFVTAKQQSLAIRLAVGAQAADVIGLVAWHCAWLTGLGIAAGAPLAWAATRLLENQVQMIEPRWILAILLTSLLIVLLVTLATLAPVRRVLRIQPSDLLRRV